MPAAGFQMLYRSIPVEHDGLLGEMTRVWLEESPNFGRQLREFILIPLHMESHYAD